jgi:protein phosphatase
VRAGRSTVASHSGRRRRHNEDAYVIKPPIFAVADGMGGARGGEVASSLAAEAVRADEADGSAKERVVALVQRANRSIYERSSSDADVSGMGTTITLALVEDGHVTFAHVGDSRAYVLREGKLEQLTDDHSLVAELVRSGKLSPEEAEHHPQRSVITRVLGTDPDVDVDTFVVDTRPGDVFVICSDGLTDMLGDEEIGSVLAERTSDLDEAAKELVRRANKAGGDDNITVVAFEITDEPPREDGEPDELEQTRVQTLPRESRPGKRPPQGSVLRFVPLLLLIVAMLAAAAVLWVLVH